MLRTVLIVVGSIFTTIAALTGLAVLLIVLLLLAAPSDARDRKRGIAPKDNSRIALVSPIPTSDDHGGLRAV